jgi:hypothetical protein
MVIIDAFYALLAPVQATSVRLLALVQKKASKLSSEMRRLLSARKALVKVDPSVATME